MPVQRVTFVYPELLDAPCKIYPGRAAGHFLHCIRQCAVTIRCQRLQGLKKRRAAENDAAHQDGAPGIGEAKERTDDRKCDDMFKMRIGFHLWPQQERRELIIYGVDETDVGEGRVRNEDDRCPR